MEHKIGFYYLSYDQYIATGKYMEIDVENCGKKTNAPKFYNYLLQHLENSLHQNNPPIPFENFI